MLSVRRIVLVLGAYHGVRGGLLRCGQVLCTWTREVGGAAVDYRARPAGARRQAAPAMYRAIRQHSLHRSVTCDRGAGGNRFGVRSIVPEHEGQLSGLPLRSLAIRCSACAGLYVAGRGLRMNPPRTAERIRADGARFAVCVK